MSEQTLKDSGIELKKLELKKDDILIVEFDLNKNKPYFIDAFMKMIKENFNNKVLAIPNTMNIKNYSKEILKEFQKRFNEEVDKILKGE